MVFVIFQLIRLEIINMFKIYWLIRNSKNEYVKDFYKGHGIYSL
jgi:hypothetical protein